MTLFSVQKPEYRTNYSNHVIVRLIVEHSSPCYGASTLYSVVVIVLCKASTGNDGVNLYSINCSNCILHAVVFALHRVQQTLKAFVAHKRCEM